MTSANFQNAAGYKLAADSAKSIVMNVVGRLRPAWVKEIASIEDKPQRVIGAGIVLKSSGEIVQSRWKLHITNMAILIEKVQQLFRIVVAIQSMTARVLKEAQR